MDFTSSNTPLARNTPKGVGVNGNVALIPSAYTVKALSMQNSKGKTVDIQSMVTGFTITEELFSPVIVFNARIRDTINFFEDFAISGQEIINIKLQKVDVAKQKSDPSNITQRDVDLNFIVKEYPNYEKTATNIGTQEYNLIAVSDYGYLSMLKRISRSVKGNVAANIQKIFENDLNITRVLTRGVCSTSFDGVLTIQSPLKAVEWLRQKAYDVNGAPFFVYNTISSGVVLISSLTQMIKSPLYSTYRYHQFLKNTAETPESYSESMGKILNMRSNIKLDKLKQATEGGFANRTDVTDYAKKSFITKIFDYSKDDTVAKNRLVENTAYGQAMNFFSKGKTSPAQNLTNSPDASRSILSVNSNANSSGAPNSSGPLLENMGRAKSYLANLESMNHEIEVYGDFRLNPGRKIKIEVPKSSDPTEYNANINKTNTEELDLSMSGEYLVAVAVHSFKEGVYTSRLKIVKDSA
jgi:hypothetical protein